MSLSDDIRALMIAAQMDQTQFAKAMGVKQPTVSRWLSGSEPEVKQMRALRRFAAKRGLEFAPYGDIEDIPSALQVPVVGYVGAGAVAHFYDSAQGPFDTVPAPEGASEDTVAAEIRGESLGSFFDRWLVFFDDIRRPVTQDLIGQLCIVGLADERVLIKRLKKSRGRRYHLMSQFEEPILDVEVTWAARIKSLAPR